MAAESLLSLSFWIFSTEKLESIAERLAARHVIIQSEYDYENVYEWFTATVFGLDLKLNVARKHGDGQLDPDEPIVFGVWVNPALLLPQNIVREVALRVSEALDCSVHIGTAIYDSDDVFQYKVSEVIQR